MGTAFRLSILLVPLLLELVIVGHCTLSLRGSGASTHDEDTTLVFSQKAVKKILASRSPPQRTLRKTVLGIIP
eukprot:5131496-Amphidinium_carterae.1